MLASTLNRRCDQEIVGISPGQFRHAEDESFDLLGEHEYPAALEAAKALNKSA